MPDLTPHKLPDGEIFMMSDRLILLDRFESIATLGWKLGEKGQQPAVHTTFIGRKNGTEGRELDNVTVAFSPEDAVQLCNAILDSVEALQANLQ